MLPLSLDLACACHLWILTDFLVAGFLFGRLFSPWHFSLSTSFSDDHFLSIRFALVIFESWQPLSFWQLRSLLFFFWHFFPYSLHSPTLFTAIPILFPTFFSSLLSSRLSSTIYSSSPLYRLHISTVLTPILSSHLYFFHTSTFFTSLLSSHLYILHISAVFTSLLSSHLYILHISALYISTLLTSHFYLFAISSVQQSLGILLLFNHRFVFASVFMCLCVSVCSPSPLHRVAYW